MNCFHHQSVKKVNFPLIHNEPTFRQTSRQQTFHQIKKDKIHNGRQEIIRDQVIFDQEDVGQDPGLRIINRRERFVEPHIKVNKNSVHQKIFFASYTILTIAMLAFKQMNDSITSVGLDRVITLAPIILTICSVNLFITAFQFNFITAQCVQKDSILPTIAGFTGVLYQLYSTDPTKLVSLTNLIATVILSKNIKDEFNNSSGRCCNSGLFINICNTLFSGLIFLSHFQRMLSKN